MGLPSASKSHAHPLFDPLHVAQGDGPDVMRVELPARFETEFASLRLECQHLENGRQPLFETDVANSRVERYDGPLHHSVFNLY